jgi:DNA-binding LytR/AlgR family response regulator
MIKCVAIDDEPIALSILEEYARRHGGIELKTFTSPIEGMECVDATRPQVVFLDIEMKSHNGLELARKLPEGTCLIFTTAFSNYAMEGFNVDAVDFLHKPIFYERFERALEKASKWLGINDSPDGGGSRQEVLTVKVEHKTVLVKLSDITHVEAMDNYVKIHRRDLPMVLSQITMKEMENRLPGGKFIRVHRSYIIARDSIDRFTNRQVYLKTKSEPIPVGRTYSGVLAEVIGNEQGNIG